MKTANFPARKEARKVAATARAEGAKGVTARAVYSTMPNLEVVRAARSKKTRAGKRF